MKIKPIILIQFGFLLMVTTSAVDAKPRNGIEFELLTCQKIQADKKRLACFDQTVEKLKMKRPPRPDHAANGPKASIKADKFDQAKQKPRQFTEQDVFGMEQKVIAESAPNSLLFIVSKTIKNAYGQLTVYFTNGQVWKQTSSHRLRLKEGEEVEIKRGIMGAFRLHKKDSNRGFDVKRMK